MSHNSNMVTPMMVSLDQITGQSIQEPTRFHVEGNNSNEKLEDQMRIHGGDISYKGIRTCNVLTHPRIQIGLVEDKPYTCGVCGKGFGDNNAYHIHIRSHTGIKQYTCDVCSKGFSHHHSYKRHFRIHTEKD